MKVYFLILPLCFLLLFSGCDNPNGADSEGSINNADSVKDVTVSDSSPQLNRKNALKIQYTYLYVSSRTGAALYDVPDGSVIDSFPLNTTVVAFPEKMQQTLIGVDYYSGWLALLHEKDTVFVQKKLLAESYTISEIILYYALPWRKYDDEIFRGFVNVSESVWADSILNEEDYGKNPVMLDEVQKKRLLTGLKVSEKDTVFIYNLDKDKLFKFCIANLPAKAQVNMYYSNDEKWDSYAYEFGFDLGEKYKLDGENLTYIGPGNPFDIGKVRAIKWTETTDSLFPVTNNYKDFDGTLETYFFTTGRLDYFLQKPEGATGFDLAVFDKNTKSIIYQKQYDSGESIYIPEKIPTEYTYGYTGAIFKNKPAILYGFEGIVFGCPHLEFVGKEEPPVMIRCDNRH